MKRLTLLRLTTAFIAAFAMAACAVGGEVVKVTTVKESKLAGLKEDDLAKLEEIKKARKGQQEVDTSISNVIEATPHYSISEYLVRHPEVRGAAGADYKVGGYDVLNITVYEEKDLSREAVRISADGYISFPLIGRIMVNNLTTSEIENLISGKLAEQQYLLDAHVSVMVTGYNSKRFLVLGAAKTPGSYSLQARERVLDAISRAGGVELDQAGKKGMIIRTENINTARERKIVIEVLPGFPWVTQHVVVSSLPPDGSMTMMSRWHRGPVRRNGKGLLCDSESDCETRRPSV